MQALMQDLRYTFRQLWSAKGLTFLAVITLALGIGSNAALFTVVESVMLRPLPYKGSGRLTHIGPKADPKTDGAAFNSTSWLNYRDIRDQATSFDSVAGYTEDVTVIESSQGAQSATSPRLTTNTFAMLGIQPLLGRTFTAEDGNTGAAPVVVISENLWRKAFHADPAILGRTLKTGGITRSVIGVMPSSFRFPEPMGPDVKDGVWLPLQPTPEMLKDRGFSFFVMIAKVRPGVTLSQAQDEVNAIARRIRQAEPEKSTTLAFSVDSYQQLLTGPVRPAFYALIGALALVLLIACANVANLLLARCLGRRQEFGVRVALGASRGRLVRQMLTEGAVLSLAGCALGLLLAQAALALIRKLPDGTIPRADDISIHWTILIALAAVATITTLLSSLLPSLLVVRTNPQTTLQAASRGLGARSGNNRLSNWLVISEVGLCTLLLIGTGLLFHTLWNLQHADLGFQVQRVTTFTALPPDSSGFSGMGITDAASAPISVSTLTYQPVLDRLRQLPGVQSAALMTSPPLSGINIGSSFDIIGQPKETGSKNSTRVSAVSSDYARTLGIAVVRGRAISTTDTATAPFRAVINEAFAKKYFPGRDPLQQQIDLGGKDTGMLKPYTIVGVLADQIDSSVSGEARPLILLSDQQVPTSSVFYAALLQAMTNFVVKSRGDFPLASSIRGVFHSLAPGYALDNFKSMQQAVDESLFSQRLGLYLTSAFAALAILMLIAGLYGVLAQVVGYRRREIGIRMALGATRRSMAEMVFRQAIVLIGIGLGSGLILAAMAGRVLQSFLYHVQTLDAISYLGTAVLAIAIGIIASLVPAHRAASIEPMEALRED